jgi:nucleoside-diphosphate-sugar epimerase
MPVSRSETANEAQTNAPTVLVTGATGFIGSFFMSALADGHSVRAANRAQHGDLGPNTDWTRALDGVDAVVHAAGPAHTSISEGEARRAIVEGSAVLARQAARAGVQRFIYVSSIRAIVDRTKDSVDEHEQSCASDIYGRAKYDAEQAVLAELPGAAALRPPLVVGPNPKANLAQFLKLLDSPAPLPFAGISNKRNIVSLASLAEAVSLLLEKSDASGVFHVADQPAVSTAEMASLLRQGMGRPSRLFSAPGIELIAPKPLVQSLEINDSRLRALGYRGQDACEALIACGAAWAKR